MAKKIATVESLDTKAANCGFDSGVVKNKFFNKYGNTFPNKRCPTKSTITQTLSGMVKSISYGGSRPSNALVPIDDVNFYQYDVNNVGIQIYNEGNKEIYKNAMTIDFYMNNKNVGSKEIPSSNINVGGNKNESNAPFVQWIHKNMTKMHCYTCTSNHQRIFDNDAVLKTQFEFCVFPTKALCLGTCIC